MAKEQKRERKRERKPDYDEKEIPKVLKGPVEPPKEDKPESVLEGAPLRARPDYGEDPVGPQATMMKEIPIKDLGENKPPVMPDYDESEGCPCQHPPTGEPGAVSEEVCMPGGSEDGSGGITILVCPDCGNEGPFKMAPPAGIMMEARTLKCAKCKSEIPFKGIVKTAAGKYVVARVYVNDTRKSLITYLKDLLGEKFTPDIEIKVNRIIDQLEMEALKKPGIRLAGSDCIKPLADRIRGIVKQGTIITWDLAQDVNTTLDKICKMFEGKKKDKD